MKCTRMYGSLVALACCVVTLGVFASAARAADEKKDEKATTQPLNVGGIPGGSKVTGVVKFSRDLAKEPVKRKEITDISNSPDKTCIAAYKDGLPLSEQYVFGDNNTLQNVFVYVSKGLEGKNFTFTPTRQPEIDQKGCLYHPHVQGMLAGQALTIKNGDNTLHNVKYESAENGNDNFGTPAGVSMPTPKKFTKPEMPVKFGCSVHSWMSAYVMVMDNPFYAVTQQDGTFTITGLPPGDYEVSVWHEFDKFKAKEGTLKVTVPATGDAKPLEFVFDPPAKK